jgi:hypothetical protein
MDFAEQVHGSPHTADYFTATPGAVKAPVCWQLIIALSGFRRFICWLPFFQGLT